MAELFNPYHIWLGIPAQELPANHYRLLSVPLFEANADAIDSAADRQMAHLRTFQTGKHGDLTQRMLNEVSAARVCLLDPKKRAAYDQQLRATLPATTAAVPATNEPVAGGSAIQRQPPRRATAGAPSAMPIAAPLSGPVAAAAPQAADPWNDLLGDPNAKPASRPGSNSAKAATAKRSANNRMIPLAIAGGLVLMAVVGFVALSSGGASEGTLVFDWPAADRANTNVIVDNSPIAIPASGPWEFSCAPGPHRIVADHLAYKFDAKVDVAAGQRQSVAPDWKAKATLVLNWPLAMRSGAELKIDGRVQTISQHEPLEVAVEQGRRQIQITRPGFDPIHTTATVAADSRELVSIAAPPTTAKLAFDWPAAERKDAQLIVDGQTQTVAADSDSLPFELTLSPGRHVVHIARAGYEPFNQAVDLAAGAESSIKPTWKPEQKAAPTVVETQTPVETVAQPAKKLAVPPPAEQERIAKQLESLYKISKPDAKDAAKAQELYDVAAKDGSTPAERYMLLLKGAEVAAVAGDLNLSLQGIDALDADFEINVLDLKQKLLEKFINGGKPDQVAIAIPAAEQLVDQAVAADQYEIALVLATTASHAATKSKIATRKEVEERLSRRRHDIHVIEPLYAAAKKAQETLDKNPADAEANLIVGRWNSFYKGDWANGLPLLAKGGDEKLESLATEELKAPTDAEQQAHLADAWWDLAQKEAGAARDSIHLHAGNIYQGATPNLASALRKAAIEKRLAEIAELKPIGATPNVSNPVAAGNPTSATKFPLNQWVDVLRLVDTDRDRVAGKWSRAGKDLISVDGGRITIPVVVDGGYDLEVFFTRFSGTSDVATMFSIGAHSSMATLSGWNGAASGLVKLDGLDAFDDTAPIAVRPGSLNNGHRYRLLLSIRVLSENRASIDLSLDGKRYLPHWEGNPSSLSEYDAWAMPKHKELGLGAGQSGATFHSARLRMVSGHASSIAESTPPQVAPFTATSNMLSGAATFPLNKWVDVMRLVNADEDSIVGRWVTADGEVSTEDPNKSILEIPLAIDGGFDLETEFTRRKGKDDVHVVFPVGSHECNAVLSALGGAISGLYEINHQGVEQGAASTRPGTLENGQRYQLMISVRLLSKDTASIKVSLDGKPYLPDWEGSVESCSVGSDWAPLRTQRVVIGQRSGQVAFHSLRLRMVSGQANADPALDPTKRALLPKVELARWGAGDNWSDVTGRVRNAVTHGETVFVGPEFFGFDPIPGVAKTLEISFKRTGSTDIISLHDGESLSKNQYEKLSGENK